MELTSDSYGTIFPVATKFFGLYAWILQQTAPPPWYKGNLYGHSCKWILAGDGLSEQDGFKADLKKYGKSRDVQPRNSAGREVVNLKTPAAYIPLVYPVNSNQFSL